jgi:hypothetical protein
MENSENDNCQVNWYHKRRRLFIGAMFLTIGAFILFSQLNPYLFHLPFYFFSWKIFLIVLGVLFMIFRKRWWTGINLIIIGTVFLIPDLMGLDYSDIWKFWPIVLILMGISMIFKPKSQCWEHRHWDNEHWKDKHYWKHHYRHHHNWNHRWNDEDERWFRNEKDHDDEWKRK